VASRACIVALAGLATTTCASLDGLRGLVQAPRFEQADTRPSEIRLTGPSVTAPAGGASVRLWTTVTNPNAFGLTVATLRATLHLEGSRAAIVDFPLGLPLQARSEADVPIDIVVDFRDVPGLGQALGRVLSRQPIGYQLEGTVSVAAGAFGEPVFGPMTILRGEIR
jgi:hypothetical protein